MFVLEFRTQTNICVFCRQNICSVTTVFSLLHTRGTSITSLQMFCLQNTQMFVYVLNSRTNIGFFYMYLSVMDNKYFSVIFSLNQTLNPLKNKHSLSNLQRNFYCFNKLFSYRQNFLSFFAGYEI